MRIVLIFTTVLVSALVSGCSSEPAPAEAKTTVKKGPVIPTGPIPALTAYYEMYKMARTWAPDVATASLTGSDAGGVKGAEGKYPQWTAVFVSPSKQMAATYTYSTVEDGRNLRGFNNNGTQRWAGATQAAEPFANSDFSIDSDAAWSAASEKAKDWVAKNPGKEISTFALGHSARFPVPMWYILWGTKTSGYAAFVNASTGKIFDK